MSKELEAEVATLKKALLALEERLKTNTTKKAGKVIDRVKTYEDACTELGLSAAAEIPYPTPIGKRQKVANARQMLDIIAEAIQEDFMPDWKNTSQYKYFPWFEANSSGSGFACSYYADWTSDSRCGSRLCFDTAEKATYFGKQFIELHNEAMTK